jgi:hypothetical protein
MRRSAAIVIATLLAGCSSAVHPQLVHVQAGRPAATDHAVGNASDFRVVSASRVGAGVVVMVASAAAAYHLYRSTDDARTWSRITDPPGDLSQAEVAFADADRGWLLRRAVTSGRAVLFATTDGGTRWTRTTIRGGMAVAAVNGYGYLLSRGELYVQGPLDGRFAPFERTSADTLVLSDGTVLAYRSIPRLGRAARLDVFHGTGMSSALLPCGTTWSQAVAVRPGEFVAVCGSEPGAGNQAKTGYVSADGRSWRRTRAPDGAGYVETATASGARAFVAGSRMAAVWTSVDGASWRGMIVLPSEGFWTLGFVDGVHGWAVDGGPPSALYVTDDGGLSWHLAARPG